MTQRHVDGDPVTGSRAPDLAVVAVPQPRAASDTTAVSIGDLTVIASADRDERGAGPGRPWRGPIAVAVAVVVLVAGVVVGRTLLTDDGRPAAPAVVGAAATPDPLSVDVTAASTSVVYGEPLVVQFSWHDGDGTLIDVNRVEATAVSYRRDVPCDKSVARPHAISDQGSWTYVPDAMSFGPPPTEPRLVHVGLEVRTGGCAPTERAVEQLTITVLPPA